MNKKDIGKRDLKKYNSHHKKNYLIVLSNNSGTVKRCFVNSLDDSHALRLALVRYCRQGIKENITRARVAGVYDNGKKTIETRIG